MKLSKRQRDVLAELCLGRHAYISKFVFQPGYGLFLSKYGNGRRVPVLVVEALLRRGCLTHRDYGYRITEAGRKALEAERD